MLNKFLKSRIKTAKSLVNELSKSYDYVSVLGSYAKTKRIVSSTKTTGIDEMDNECGFVIKVYKDGRYSEYSCDDIDGLSVNTVKKAITLKDVPEFRKVPVLKEDKTVKSYAREDGHPLGNKEILEKLEAIRHEQEKYNEKIILSNLVYIKHEVSKIFVSTNKCLDQKYDWINGIMVVVTRDGNNIQQNFHTENEADSELVLKELDEVKFREADVALKMLEAKPIVPGVYDIITDQSISGLIAHEAFGHGVEMDMFVKNRAKAKDYVGKYVASPIVNMYDGAASALSAASYFFDDDGVEAHNTQIIKDGILVSGISDSLSALELDKEPTGNGRRESYERKVYTRMTNTFFAKGKDKFDDMVKSIKHGYYLCQTNNGMEDPKNWQIQCTAAYGLEIKDGKFTGEIVAPVVISGYVVDLLSSISMVSDDFKVIGSGMCGKGHKEWVFVSDGGPNLKARAKLG